MTAKPERIDTEAILNAAARYIVGASEEDPTARLGPASTQVAETLHRGTTLHIGTESASRVSGVGGFNYELARY